MKKRALCLIFAFLMLFPSPVQASGKVEADAFEDVSPNSPFYEAILWAVETPSASNPITKGITPISFAPSEQCTRAQILTFIWRYRKSPKVSADPGPYEDTIGKYYQDAAAWAFANGYEFGDIAPDGKRVFNAQTPCTRATAVIYLWRLAGRPMVSLDKARVFRDMSSDASEESISALQAVAWAMQNGVTNGTSETTFSPEKVCTRGQIVTFLYRYNNSVATN